MNPSGDHLHHNMCKWLPLEFCSAQLAGSYIVALSFLALPGLRCWLPLILRLSKICMKCCSQWAHAHPTKSSLKTSETTHQQMYYTWPWIKINSSYDRLLLLDLWETMLRSHKQRCFKYEKKKTTDTFGSSWLATVLICCTQEKDVGGKEKMRNSTEEMH
jgi:hypothetical protein